MKNPYLKAVVAVLLFLAAQIVAGAVMIVAAIVMHPESAKQALAGGLDPSLVPPSALALGLMVSGVLACLAMWWLRIIRLPQAFDCRVYWPAALLGILGAVFGILSTDLLSEQLQLPDLMADQMQGMADSVWGVLAVAFVGPIVEELGFREGVQGSLLRGGVPAWVAAVVSALCFGLIHANPAQIPFAFIMGLILAVIYQKTGNVVVTSLVHILNNSLAVLEMHLLGDHIGDFRYDQWLGLSPVEVWVMMAALAVICLCFLRLFWRNYPSQA
ncbi:MAG: CPBP family intramembrane metalloprotease [Bacteroidaceae bacterium]|nr:CPBP family intramembrane metalloprotease [Bacteroidaceae bacterium]